MNKTPPKKVDTLSPQEKKNVKKTPKIFKDIVTGSLRYSCLSALFLKLLSEGKNPFEVKKIMTQRTTGFRVNTIIWNPLFLPDITADNEKLFFQTASAGRWNAYDFLRTDVLSSSATSSHHFHDVQLLFFPLEELKNNDSQTETPEGLFDIFNVNHMVEFTKFSVDQALQFWAIEQTTYYQAYEKIWNTNLLRDVEQLSIAEKKVYQITPKGSTLIFPFKWWWDKTPSLPEKKTEKQTNGIFQPI